MSLKRLMHQRWLNSWVCYGATSLPQFCWLEQKPAQLAVQSCVQSRPTALSTPTSVLMPWCGCSATPAYANFLHVKSLRDVYASLHKCCLTHHWACMHMPLNVPQGCCVPDACSGGQWRLAAAAHQRRVQQELHDHLRQLQVTGWALQRPACVKMWDVALGVEWGMCF